VAELPPTGMVTLNPAAALILADDWPVSAIEALQSRLSYYFQDRRNTTLELSQAGLNDIGRHDSPGGVAIVLNPLRGSIR